MSRRRRNYIESTNPENWYFWLTSQADSGACYTLVVYGDQTTGYFDFDMCGEKEDKKQISKGLHLVIPNNIRQARVENWVNRQYILKPNFVMLDGVVCYVRVCTDGTEHKVRFPNVWPGELYSLCKQLFHHTVESIPDSEIFSRWLQELELGSYDNNTDSFMNLAQ